MAEFASKGVAGLMSKHKVLEALEKLNNMDQHSAEYILEYKDTLKALYYLLSIEKAK